jgi:hypothetical protein
MDDPMARIIDQAQKALAGEPVRGLEMNPPGLYGLTHVELRLGNIIAIARAARGGRDE